jgi:hypothetical protein
MTLQPENISGGLYTWKATNELRWVVSRRRKMHNQQLQQKWVNCQTRQEEWRDVPMTTGED